MLLKGKARCRKEVASQAQSNIWLVRYQHLRIGSSFTVWALFQLSLITCPEMVVSDRGCLSHSELNCALKENRLVLKVVPFHFSPSNRVAPVTCGTLILSLQMSQSPTPSASLQTASSSPPVSKKLLRHFWASPMPHPWILSYEHFSFFPFFNNNNYYFCFLFGLLVELPVDRSSWNRICTFPPWQLCSLNFNYTVCWKLFWRAHHSLNERYRLWISIRSSPEVVLSPRERKIKVTAAIGCYSRL